MRAVKLPVDGFEHPFRDSEDRRVRYQRMDHPRTVSVGFLHSCCKFSTSPRQIVELRMCALSNHIRERPNWWEEVKDKATLENWREEILKQQGASEDAPSMKLTPAMVKICYVRTTPLSSF